jgi:DNA-binding MarR family transcriptional regulator
MTRALAVMTDQHWGEYPDAAEPADLSPGAPPFCPKARAHMVRNLIRHRRRREQLFGAEVFADPVWDILLDLYASHHEGKNVAVTSLCIAAAVPPTTALRWIKVMTEKGWLVRTRDPADGRRVYVDLGADALARLDLYFAGLPGV